jgi:hypothetical protein
VQDIRQSRLKLTILSYAASNRYSVMWISQHALHPDDTPSYDPTMSTAANRQTLYNINSDNSLASGLGLGVVTNTIGSGRLISMSLHVLF